jgi:hypothetical protein
VSLGTQPYSCGFPRQRHGKSQKYGWPEINSVIEVTGILFNDRTTEVSNITDKSMEKINTYVTSDVSTYIFPQDCLLRVFYWLL